MAARQYAFMNSRPHQRVVTRRNDRLRSAVSQDEQIDLKLVGKSALLGVLAAALLVLIMCL